MFSTDADEGRSAPPGLPSVRRVRLSQRSNDDADVIRARLRTVLDQTRRTPGWVPVDVDVPALNEPRDTSGRSLSEGSDDEPAWSADPAVPGVGRHRAPAPTARLDPGRRGVWALAVAGLVAAAVIVVWTWLDRPRVTPAPPRPATSSVAAGSRAAPSSPAVGEVAVTSATVVVSVVGLVAHPGVVTVSTGARVADAVAAAGGLLREADPASVNMAALVADGQQIAIGVPGAATRPGSSGAASAAPGPVNLNTATAGELDALPGIGPVLAQRIVDYRSQQGRFTTVDQLDDVPGIGPALYARLAGSVTV